MPEQLDLEEDQPLEQYIETPPDNRTRGENALWKHWAHEIHLDSGFTGDNGVTGYPDLQLDEWEKGYVEAYAVEVAKRRAAERRHEREIHDRGMLDYYKGYEQGLKNAKKHLIKMMVEEDKQDESN